jgi:carboxylate-amine ligase
MLVRRPERAQPWTPFTRRLIDENRWRAKRHGLDAEFLSLDGSPPVPCRDVVKGLLEEVAEDAQSVGCEKPIERVRAILGEGTSAHSQLTIYRGRRAKGDTPYEALRFVVDWLVATTVSDLPAREAAAAALPVETSETPQPA